MKCLCIYLVVLLLISCQFSFGQEPVEKSDHRCWVHHISEEYYYEGFLYMVGDSSIYISPSSKLPMPITSLLEIKSKHIKFIQFRKKGKFNSTKASPRTAGENTGIILESGPGNIDSLSYDDGHQMAKPFYYNDAIIHLETSIIGSIIESGKRDVYLYGSQKAFLRKRNVLIRYSILKH